ncbi:MAG: hypothetical protein WAL45_01290 [Terracidiphilus sp.]
MKHPVHAPTMIHFGELTDEELLVSYKAAVEDAVFENASKKEPPVMPMYFGPRVNRETLEDGDLNN